MHLKFDATKAIESAAVIARCEKKRISRLRLLKLLYIADREAIKRRGRPLLGSKAVAMDHGPLHSDVYDLIKGEHPASPQWSRYFTDDGLHVLLTAEPDNLALSRSDIEILHETAEKHENVDDWALSKLTHEFAEWQSVYEEGTSRPISLEGIIDGVGRNSEQQSIIQDIKDDEVFDRFFERHFQ